jgi:hypothetical protein
VRSIRTAADARAMSKGARALVPSPAAFEGTLEELSDRYVMPNLPLPEAVTAFHRILANYVRRTDALFLVRYTSRTARKEIYSAADGVRFRATDNAPAWWTFAALAQDYRIAPDAIGEVVATMPAHLFQVAATCGPTAAEAGWHIAHIFDVKDGNTGYERWVRSDVVRRFIRNIHPCNYFLLPRPDWQRWGSDKRVVGYFGQLYSERYADVWPEFLELAEANDRTLLLGNDPIAYSYARNESSQERARSAPTLPVSAYPAKAITREYRASRLTFKRDVIEALEDDAVFRVVTPLGTFEMSKADVYRVYPGVPASRSYRETGSYNYSCLPRSAEQFRVVKTEEEE